MFLSLFQGKNGNVLTRSLKGCDEPGGDPEWQDGACPGGRMWEEGLTLSPGSAQLSGVGWPTGGPSPLKDQQALLT